MNQHSPSVAQLSQSDPTGSVDLESPRAVEAAIRAILDGMPGGCPDTTLLTRAFDDLIRAYRGDYPGLLRCDTLYHDLRHALETGLTMARLLDGEAMATGPDGEPHIDRAHALLGIILALYHDIGLLRHTGEEDIWGASLTPVHEERGVIFLREYLAGTSLAGLADKSELIMPTKLVFKIPASWPALHKKLGSMIATADLLSQMSDRCYIEKCRDFLFLEFSAIGLAGTADTPYPDRETLLHKTPDFYSGFIAKRLGDDFGNVRHYIADHFDGIDPYDEAIRRNLAYLGNVLASHDFARLRRHPKVFVAAEA
ncbi:MAG: hypothetical protein KJ787_00310 [Gammaproteobacteria bacterium]|nr:hypothetical protein [Gammaproteobacteria bacterium]MBU1644759.1 hypothetical protein [Gammaproteobacteria bacterium]MBU1973493.1 hypothetical protein [Gammaproteobacteria bacterium]